MAKTAAKKPLRGLHRQKAYLEKVTHSGSGENSFFVTETVIESMRDSGYRDVRKALNDLIDNAQQAGAKKVAVLSTTQKVEPNGTKERISNIAVIDDGHGMYPEMLPVAVKWGGTDRHDQRDGLGRFGFGLPTASVSVTRTYEVYSKIKGGEWYKVNVDLTEIANNALSNGGKLVYNLNPEKTKLPDYLGAYIKKIWKADDLEQGTVVLLMNPDRIRRFSQPLTFQQRMLENVGLTYRHFMPALNFYVNDRKVDMVDPLFLNPNSRGYDAGNGVMAEGRDDLVLAVDHTINGKPIRGNVTLRFAFLPESFQRDKDDQLIKPRWSTMKENNGYFIVTRAGRQIDVVRDTDYSTEEDNTTIVTYDANWVMELDFEPSLDELFGITINKQQVEIDSYLWELFKAKNIPALVTSFRTRFKRMKVKGETNKEKTKTVDRASEQIMSDAEKFDKIDIPREKEELGEQRLQNQAQEIASVQKRDLAEVLQFLQSDAEKKKFKVEFTDLPGAPFYDVDMWGPNQIQVMINSAHRFYSHIYSQQDNRGKTAIELLLFVLSKCEIEATGEKELFYGNERYEWSRKLDLRLKLLDKRDPITDKQAFEEEADN
jgi:hypothetical protein